MKVPDRVLARECGTGEANLFEAALHSMGILEVLCGVCVKDLIVGKTGLNSCRYPQPNRTEQNLDVHQLEI